MHCAVEFVSTAESEQFAGLITVMVMAVMGNGRPSVVEGGKYAARSAAGSSLSAGASGAACTSRQRGRCGCGTCATDTAAPSRRCVG